MAAEPLQIADSSHVKGAAYDPETQELVITFPQGASYSYSGVPQQIAEGLSAAPSAGSYLHQFIKGLYPAKRL